MGGYLLEGRNSKRPRKHSGFASLGGRRAASAGVQLEPGLTLADTELRAASPERRHGRVLIARLVRTEGTRRAFAARRRTPAPRRGRCWAHGWRCCRRVLVAASEGGQRQERRDPE